MTKHDYTDKPVYIGIDVHKKTYTLTCIHADEVVKRDTIQASPSALVRYMEKYFNKARIYTAYEAGFCGFHLHRHLESSGFHSQVVHAGSIEISSRDRVKTDKRDSHKIATQLAAGRLTGIYVPTAEREDMRYVSRLRSQYKRKRQQVGNQLKSHLHLLGYLTAADTRVVSARWVKSLLEQCFDKGSQFVIQMLGNEWLELTEKIKRIDKELQEQAHTDGALETIYQSAPGIGPVHGRQLANELGDMQQFQNVKALSSFTGMTPAEYSSGDKRYLGHMSRQGRSLLRAVLVEAAWVAIRKDKRSKDVFDRISATAGKKRAIIAVARHLIIALRACFQTGELYRQEAIESTVH